MAVVIWVIVFGPDSPDSGATQIDPQQGQIDELIMDRDNLPDVYTGELADIDADGTTDLALFGDPDAPVLRPLTEPRPRDWAPFLAAIPAVAIVLAALVTQVGAWARNKRAEPEPHTDDST